MGSSDNNVDLDLAPGDILVAIDGEPHTEPAVHWSLQLASALHKRVVAVHVRDPYLKQFYNEIYAQGRQAYLDHVDACLDEIAVEARAAFERATEASDVSWSVKVRDGDPADELLAEIREGDYGLLIVGARASDGSRRKRKSALTKRLFAEVRDLPTLVVPG